MTNRSCAVVFLSLALTLCISGCSQSAKPLGKKPAPPVVTATFSKIAPRVDGRNEDVWKAAPATRVKLKNSSDVITLKVLYTKRNIYVQAVYPDATHDYIDRPWMFNGTAWKQKGQQDSLCFIWNIDNSIRGFNERGFAILTKGLELDKHPWEIAIDGGKLSEAKPWFRAQKGDFWSTGLQLPYGKAEDWVLKEDKARWANGDWHLQLRNQHDANKNGVPWLLNKSKDWSRPIWVLRPGLTIEQDPHPVRADMVDAAGYTPTAGEVQPFIVYVSRQARWGGSKDDVDGAETWQKGVWTVEMGRLLDTGHNDDISFKPASGKTYYFGLLVRREGRRYEPTDPVRLVFK